MVDSKPDLEFDAATVESQFCCGERRQKLELELHYENCIRIPGTWCNTQSNAQGLNVVRITARTMVKVIKLQNFPTNRAARRSENGHKCNHRNRQ